MPLTSAPDAPAHARPQAQAQAQLQGMAAAAQWGQPAAQFGMAGAGMWPAYPAMVAPGYGVGSNWAAAAQLNARCVLQQHAARQQALQVRCEDTGCILTKQTKS